MTFPELMFYAETAGLLPTRAGKINAVIAAIKDYPVPEIEFKDFEEILYKYGLTYEDLTDREIKHINTVIAM